MPKPMLIDTDVLIDFLKGKEAAVVFLESQVMTMFTSLHLNQRTMLRLVTLSP